ncbi:MAG TPA: hypothetical protein VKM94_24550 [Blastocatellia bacterium]|nr:hypothetical protein [Blastocatellia bacterium]
MAERGVGSETRGKLEDDVDALFKLPLAEFIGARNDLASRLKRDGRANDATLVKALAKPSVTAWAVNQLHWKHRDALDHLLETGQRVRQAQTSQAAGKVSDMRTSLDERRDALSHLSDLATVLLRDAGHNPTPDTIHRVTTTLEALSAYAMLSDGPTPGRLTHDVDPPGFETLASLIPLTQTAARSDATRVAPSPKSDSAATKTQQSASRAADAQKVSQAEETRRARIAAAKVSLQEAKRSMAEARADAQRLEAAHKKARAEAKEAEAKAEQAEKQLRDADERFKKASAASHDAAQGAQRAGVAVEEAAHSVEDARRNIEKASKELESLLQESGSK